MLVGMAYIGVVGVLWILPLDVLSLYFQQDYLSRTVRILQASGLALVSLVLTYGVRRWALLAGAKNLEGLDR